ncbi:MAG: SDR family oxidoreductase [Candidatus Thorarchaeota archaeon]
MSEDLRGKVIVITGTSSGIGEATMTALARMGARIVSVVRDLSRGEAAVSRTRRQVPNADIDLRVADLSQVRETIRVGREIDSEYESINVLINNAGGIYPANTLTPEGVEMTFAINYLAPFVLTRELMRALRSGAPSRVVNVSSTMHRLGRVSVDDFQGLRLRGGMRAYSSAKLLLLMHTYEAARRYGQFGVTVNALHPGAVATNFGTSGGWRTRLLFRISRPFMISPERGARTSVYLASSGDVEGITGRYFQDCREARSSPISYDEDLQRQLWEYTEDLIAKIISGSGLEPSENRESTSAKG